MKMDKKLAQDLIDHWDGESTRFLFEGEIYTEDDVWEAEQVINGK